MEVRAKELHATLHPLKQARTTTAVVEAVDAKGSTGYFVGHSDYYFPNQIKNSLNPSEIFVTKIEGHAETSAIQGAMQQGFTPLRVGASRPICTGCQPVLKQNNVQMVSPLQAVPQMEP